MKSLYSRLHLARTFCGFLLILNQTCSASSEGSKEEPEEWNDNDTGTISSSEQRHLYKCSNEVAEDLLLIPPSLQIPHNLTTNNQQLFFNFSLYLHPSSDRVLQSGEHLDLRTENNYTSHISVKNRNSTAHLYAQTLHYVTPRGFLKSNRTFYNPENYCISNISLDKITVKFYANAVASQPSISELNLPKCCPLGMVFSLNLSNPQEEGRCRVVESREFTPFLYPDLNSKNYTRHPKIAPNFVYSPVGNKQCVKKSVAIPLMTRKSKEFTAFKQIRVLENGEIYTRISGNHKWKKQTQNSPFCIDGFWDVSDGNSDAFQIGEEFQVLLSCPDNSTMDSTGLRILATIYFGAYTISAVLLFVSFVVYGCVFTKQKIYGRTVTAFVFCAFCFSLCVLLTHAVSLWGQNHVDFGLGTNFCTVLATLGHFFYVAFFSWMTVLNFDLCRTIRSMTPLSRRSKGKRAFALYCLFGFGVPLIVVGISQGIERNFGFFDDEVIRPQYARTRCFLDKMAVFYHAVIPNTILFLMNITMASITLKTLWNFRRDEKTLKNSQSQISGKKRSKIWLFLKLFGLMGFSWIFEIASELTAAADENNSLSPYWTIFDIFNALQAVFLFYIFVYKKEVQEQFSGGITRATRSISQWVSSRSSTFRASTAETSNVP